MSEKLTYQEPVQRVRELEKAGFKRKQAEEASQEQKTILASESSSAIRTLRPIALMNLPGIRLVTSLNYLSPC